MSLLGVRTSRKERHEGSGYLVEKSGNSIGEGSSDADSQAVRISNSTGARAEASGENGLGMCYLLRRHEEAEDRRNGRQTSAALGDGGRILHQEGEGGQQLSR